MILSERAGFELARKLRSKKGAPIGEVFTFLSGLYFRGKLAYSRAFSRRAGTENGVLVILPGRGLAERRQQLVDQRDRPGVSRARGRRGRGASAPHFQSS